MAKNAQGTQSTTETSDSLRTNATSTTPGVTTPNVGAVGSVGVYDQDADGRDDSTMRSTSTSAMPTSRANDGVPATTSSGGSTFTWIISAIVLIVLIYFLLQWIF